MIFPPSILFLWYLHAPSLFNQLSLSPSLSSFLPRSPPHLHLYLSSNFLSKTIPPRLPSFPSFSESQENLIRSHSAGVGPPMDPDQVRRLITLRINVLAKGFSGIRLETVQSLVDALNGTLTFNRVVLQ